jgi:hypothetical protein
MHALSHVKKKCSQLRRDIYRVFSSFCYSKMKETRDIHVDVERTGASNKNQFGKDSENASMNAK